MGDPARPGLKPPGASARMPRYLPGGSIMAKKWYDFFVVTDRTADAKDVPGRPAESGKAAAPKRAGDLASQRVPETTFAKPLADATVFDDIYSAAQIAEPAHGYSILKVA